MVSFKIYLSELQFCLVYLKPYRRRKIRNDITEFDSNDSNHRLHLKLKIAKQYYEKPNLATQDINL